MWLVVWKIDGYVILLKMFVYNVVVVNGWDYSFRIEKVLIWKI